MYKARSLEELFGLFISSALVFKSSCSVWEAFSLYDPTSPDCKQLNGGHAHQTPLLLNDTEDVHGGLYTKVHLEELALRCGQAVGVTHLVLLLGTVWLAGSIDAFRCTTYLARHVREIFADYALPIAVLTMALFAHTVFAHIPQRYFTLHTVENPNLLRPPPPQLPVIAPELPRPSPPPLLPPSLALPLSPPQAPASPESEHEFWELSVGMQALCCLLGLPLAVLFTMDQLIVTKTVDNRCNNLRKGSAHYWDLLMAALINCVCSALALPWMHAALPQSFLHLRALADVEDRFVDGTIQQVIVKNRETRCATLLAHLAMIPTYFWLIPTIRLIPTSVFHGLFVYLAVSSSRGNELCQRVALLFTEQRAYPPYHYVRRVPQRLIHAFTGVELVQWAVLFGVGFAPWPLVQLAFPLIILLFIPFRSLLLPRLLEAKYLEAIDGVH